MVVTKSVGQTVRLKTESALFIVMTLSLKKTNAYAPLKPLNPDEVLADYLGPSFTEYRKRFREAESGLRPPAPLHLDVDVLSLCQLSCPMCPSGGAKARFFPGLNRSLSYQSYLLALKQAHFLAVPSIRLGVTGEPLLIKNIDQWVSKAHQAGFIDISLITNGQALDYSMSLRLIKSGLTRLMISIDAVSEDTYAKVRPGGDFKRLINNIELFLEARERLGGPLPLLRLSFVAMKSNILELEQFKEKFSDLADYLTIQSYLDLGAKNNQALEASIADPKNPRNQSYCPDPLTRLALLADQSLFPCCSDFGRLFPVARFPQKSLAQAWNLPQTKFLASNLGRSSRACQMCLKAAGSLN
ncbi:MAG: radical SAM protein [Deltaproteobacteria bacterium]|jgi:hypothetical protein|nr:radical SAM protein [Deltaproteobacteria bacterium]